MNKVFKTLLVLTMVGTLMTTGFAGAAAAHSGGHGGGHDDGGHHDGGHGGAADGAVEQNATAAVYQDQLAEQSNVVGSINASANAGGAADGGNGGDGMNDGIQRVVFLNQGGQEFATFVWNGQEFEQTSGPPPATMTATQFNEQGQPTEATYSFPGGGGQLDEIVVTQFNGETCTQEPTGGSGTVTNCPPVDDGNDNNDDMNGDDAQTAGNATVDVGIDQSNSNTQEGAAQASNVNADADGQMANSGSSGAMSASGSSGGHHDGGHHHDGGEKDKKKGDKKKKGGADDGDVEQDATAIVDQAQQVAQQNVVGQVNATATGGNSTVTVDVSQSNDNSQFGIAEASNLNVGDSNEAEA